MPSWRSTRVKQEGLSDSQRDAPLFSFILETRALCTDHERWNSNKDHSEGLERGLEGAIVWPSAMEYVGCGQRKPKTANEALDSTNDGGTLLCVLLFFGDDLA